MTARDNVIVRLADTQSNVLLPITAERNRAFRENVENWSKVCQHLRIWDYAITYKFPHLPQPTMQTYPTDLRFLLQHNVEGEFIEFEHPIDADMRDMKLWILCKLLEDPNQDYEALVKEFTDGYYGAAGPFIRQYLTLLQDAAAKSNADVNWGFSGARTDIDSFPYLTMNFLQKADALYTKAAASVEGDPLLSRRVNVARSSVDIAILRRFRPLLRNWRQAGHSESTFPLDRDGAGKRCVAALDAQINLWLSQSKWQADQEKMHNPVNFLAPGPVTATPAKFKDVPADHLFTYNVGDMRNGWNSAKIVPDKDAESGYASRYEIPDSQLDKYKLPMPWGVYDTVVKKSTLTGVIKAGDIPSAGYHWYKLGDVTLTDHDYVYFFWSWIIQNDIVDAYDAKTPDAKYEVWADLKFEGPAFPFGKTDDKNAISVERIAVIKR